MLESIKNRNSFGGTPVRFASNLIMNAAVGQPKRFTAGPNELKGSQ